MQAPEQHMQMQQPQQEDQPDTTLTKLFVGGTHTI
jgi:hypothetical protein